MTGNLEDLGGQLARLIVQSSGIADNLQSIVNAAISEVENIYGEDESLGNAYVELKLFSGGKLNIHHFDFDDLETRDFVAKHLREEEVVLNVVYKDSRSLEFDFNVHFLYGDDQRSEVRVRIRMNFDDVVDDEFELSGEIRSDVSSLSELNGTLLWLMLKS